MIPYIQLIEQETAIENTKYSCLQRYERVLSDDIRIVAEMYFPEEVGWRLIMWVKMNLMGKVDVPFILSIEDKWCDIREFGKSFSTPKEALDYYKDDFEHLDYRKKFSKQAL